MSPDTQTTCTSKRIAAIVGRLVALATVLALLGSLVSGIMPKASDDLTASHPTIAQAIDQVGADDAEAASAVTIEVMKRSDWGIKVYPKANCKGKAKRVGIGKSAKGKSYKTPWYGREWWNNGKSSRGISKKCQNTDRKIEVDVFPMEV